MSSRLEQLQVLAAREPNDAFLQYAIALEFAGENRHSDAAATLEALMSLDPTYIPAYHQAGRMYEHLNQIEDAVRCYRTGIDAAGRQGDAHAQGEMAHALSLLE